MAVMVGNSNLGEFFAKTKRHKNSPELSFIKIFTINLPSQPFLGRHLGFHIFFHHSLIEGRTAFLQLGCFGLDIYYRTFYDGFFVTEHSTR